MFAQSYLNMLYPNILKHKVRGNFNFMYYVQMQKLLCELAPEKMLN